MSIDLNTPFSLRMSFRFPLQHAKAREELLWGAFLLVVLPGIGWILNMGHRVAMVHNMLHGRPCWPAWSNYRRLFWSGVVTLSGMVFYYFPSGLFLWAGYMTQLKVLTVVGTVLFVAATIAIPGFMTHYCKEFDASEIFNPSRALRRCFQGGRRYWRAWGVSSAALGLSFAGLLAFGVGFLVTSVWFWQVAGFSFATVLTQRFDLGTASIAPAPNERVKLAARSNLAAD